MSIQYANPQENKIAQWSIAEAHQAKLMGLSKKATLKYIRAKMKQLQKIALLEAEIEYGL